MARKKKVVEEKGISKGKELFDFINMIYQDQTTESFDKMTDDEKKKYKNSRYMIHRFLSMNPHYLPIVDAIQRLTGIPEKAHYLFFANIIPRGRQFNKYIKGDKDEKYESWMIDIVKKHYSISKREAIDCIEIYYEQNKAGLRELCERYGIDSKTLKKAKL